MAIRNVIELKRLLGKMSKLIKTFLKKEECATDDVDVRRWQTNLTEILNTLEKDKILKILFYIEIRRMKNLKQELNNKLSNQL